MNNPLVKMTRHSGKKLPRILKNSAPKSVFAPQATHGTAFTVDGEKVELRQPGTQTSDARREWRNVLDEKVRLNIRLRKNHHPPLANHADSG